MMNAKEYLNQGYKLNSLIENQRAIIEQLKRQSTSLSAIDYSADRVESSLDNKEAGFTSIVAKIIELEEKMNTECLAMQKLLHQIYEAIHKVRNVDEKLVLQCKYILFLTWEDTADRLSYSMSQVHRIHKRALRNFRIPER